MLGFTVHLIRQHELKMMYDLETNLENNISQNKEM